LTQPREWAECLSYSPNHQYLAVGAHDDSTYVYKIDDTGAYTMHYAITSRHSSAITGIDWTMDSRHIRAIDQSYAKLFFNIETKEQEGDGGTTLVDPALWATSTCKLGWEVAGVFPAGYDGTDINSVDATQDRKYICSGDDFGSMTVYRFPVLKNTQPGRRMTGHSEHVPRVRFYNSDDMDNYIISSGGMDRTYIQWKEVPLKDDMEDK